jgi:diguanylate cyclase (GGDEF)-like protein/PAS domain S-box-containing protein
MKKAALKERPKSSGGNVDRESSHSAFTRTVPAPWRIFSSSSEEVVDVFALRWPVGRAVRASGLVQRRAMSLSGSTAIVGEIPGRVDSDRDGGRCATGLGDRSNRLLPLIARNAREMTSLNSYIFVQNQDVACSGDGVAVGRVSQGDNVTSSNSRTINIGRLAFAIPEHAWPVQLALIAGEKRKLRRNHSKEEAEAPSSGVRDEFHLASLTKLAAAASQIVESDLRATIATLQAQAQRYETAINNISQGACFFDAEQRLILCNRRYAEIYRLTPEQVQPGATLREIAERRFAVGTAAMAAADYLQWCASINSSDKSRTWTAELRDGRTIHVCHQPMPDGGWVATHEDITELKASRIVAKERVSLQALIDKVPDKLWVKDASSRFIIANKATASEYAMPAAEDIIGKTDFDLYPHEVAQQFFEIEQKIIQSGQPTVDMDECIFDSSGDMRWLSTTKVPLLDEGEEAAGLLGISRDITDRKQADVLRNGQAQILEMIAMSAPLDGVLDRLMRLVESQLTGILASVLLLDDEGVHLRHGAAPSLAEAYTRAIDGVRIGPKVGSCGTAAHRRESVVVADIATDPLWEDYRELASEYGYRSCWSTPIFSHQGVVLGTFAMYSRTIREPTAAEAALIEVTTRIAGIAIERKRAEDRIHFMANHDALTGLPNRTLLKDRLAQAVLYAQRYDRWATVVFIDLDNFKVVNDSLGHNAGDELLKVVADRMVRCVRATDTVVRLGGDEFVILLFDQPKNVDLISATLQTIRAAIAEPICVEGRNLQVMSSIGIANYPKDGIDADALIANADAAMYRAKEMGRDNFQFYTPELNTKVHEKLVLQEELRNAIARSEFLLLYQPQVDLRTGRVFAVEALIRWRHPSLGIVSPDKFIPMAEESGLIVTIGDWVLHEACRQNKVWQDAGMPHLTMSVNVSARQFGDKNLVRRVAHSLEKSGLEAQYLELELTESLIMQDVEAAIATMKELQTLGVRLSIDDFGTGYSSLAALKSFPVTRLKIDKSFITDLVTNENDRAVTTAVISLGQKLNLRVIAEGVETEDQMAFLRENNCDEMQGYHFSRPVPAGEIEKLFRAVR